MAAPTDNVDEGFPTEIQERLDDFDTALSEVENVFEPLHKISLTQVHTQLSPIDKARIDLVGIYAVNSLFWMFLNTKGENPKEHGVKQELDRIRRYMDRVKEVQEKLDENVPRLDKAASKRFLRSALWQAAHKKAKDTEGGPGDGSEPMQSSSPSGQNQGDPSTPNIRHEGRPSAKRYHSERGVGKMKKKKT